LTAPVRNSDTLGAHRHRLPRYTSYPTAPHFTAAVGARTYAAWLRETPAGEPISLYLHVPFCPELCLYCGCNTTVANRYAPIAAYVDLLEQEIAFVAEHLGAARPVSHIHWGGGTPTILSRSDLLRIMDRLRSSFDIQRDAEIAIEIDPRRADSEVTETLAAIGVSRASLGVQDFNEDVQRTVNRVQPYETTALVVDRLRQAGIASLNFDLMYGLPLQTTESVLDSISLALGLAPDRIALFGYAHVPWMKRRQSLLPEDRLPDASERLRQAREGHQAICYAGYTAIGLDHFAKPGDSLAQAQRAGRLHRNFQGYTDDRASILIGLGASSIGKLPQGYVQNAGTIMAYRNALAEGGLATVRGVTLTADDRLRRDVIERLMCDLAVDLRSAAVGHGCDPKIFSAEIDEIDRLALEGLAQRDGYLITVPAEARLFLCRVGAVFDRYNPAIDFHPSLTV
jgi:oxygen-independent coproporphyrinogen-3 oxidase